MAASLTQFPWINEKNALAACRGLHLNRSWEAWIITDHEPISNKLLERVALVEIFTAFSQVEYNLSPERMTAYAKGVFPDPRGPYFYAALLLVILNAVGIYKELSFEENSQAQPSHPSTRMEKFLVVVAKATPYVMIITHVAMLIIQIRRGEASAWITLAFTGITVIDITSWKPKDYGWYLKTVLDYPAAAAAFYYANNLSRLKILFKLVLSNETLRKIIEEPFKEQMAELNLQIEELRHDLEEKLLKLKKEANSS